MSSVLLAIVRVNNDESEFGYVTLQKNMHLPYSIEDKVEVRGQEVQQYIEEETPYYFADFTQGEVVSIMSVEDQEVDIEWVAEDPSETYDKSQIKEAII